MLYYNRFVNMYYEKQKDDNLIYLYTKTENLEIPCAISISGNDVQNTLPIYYRGFNYDMVYMKNVDKIDLDGLSTKHLVIEDSSMSEELITDIKNKSIELILVIKLSSISNFRYINSEIINKHKFKFHKIVVILDKCDVNWDFMEYTLSSMTERVVVYGNPDGFKKIGNKREGSSFTEILTPSESICKKMQLTLIVNVLDSKYCCKENKNLLIYKDDFRGIIQKTNLMTYSSYKEGKLDITPFPSKFDRIREFNTYKRDTVITDFNLDVEIIYNLYLLDKYKKILSGGI